MNINKNHDSCFWCWRLGKKPPREMPSPWANIHQIFLIGTLVRYRRQLRNSIGVSGHWNLRSPAMLSNRKISYVFIFRIEFHTMWALNPQRYNLKIFLLFFTNFKLSTIVIIARLLSLAPPSPKRNSAQFWGPVIACYVGLQTLVFPIFSHFRKLSANKYDYFRC